ncbi:prophage CP4-57 regulatory protein [Sphingobium sp. MI1205]|nr:prophage CP4-57 regulatory protein [Sphingobium sp. MI1205]
MQSLEHLPSKERQHLIAAILPICLSFATSLRPVDQTSRSSSSLLRLPEVLRRTGLKRSTLYNKIAAGSFPSQIQISNNCTAWRESEIETWCANPA